MSARNLGVRRSELFTFSRMRPVRVVDLAHRLTKAGAPKDAEARLAWASDVLARQAAVKTLDDLGFDYRAYLKDWDGPDGGLPRRDHLKDPSAFDGTLIARDRTYRADLKRVEELFLAQSLDPVLDQAKLHATARLLQFVETFPQLKQAIRGQYFAPVLTGRTPFERDADTKNPEPPMQTTASLQAKGLHDLTEKVDLAWRTRNAMVAGLEKVYLDLRRQRGKLLRDAYALPPAEAPMESAEQKAAEDPTTSAKAGTHRQKRRDIAQQIETARRAYETASWNTSVSVALREADASTPAAGAEEIRTPSDTPPQDDAGQPDQAQAIADTLDALLARLVQEKDGKPHVEGSFCQIMAELLKLKDQIDLPLVADPGAEGSDTLRSDAPKIKFKDSVQMLGKAELVRVQEEFVSYSAGEISYIQTAMHGERRLRKTSSENMQETLLEQLEDTTSDQSEETTATTKSALRNEIETELSTRFDSNLSVSGSGEGGGSVGVVNFSGSGSASAGLGLGVDTGVRTQNETNFSQEIVRKAVERTTQRTLERRTSRTKNTFATLNEYEITNETGGPMNGAFVFLNKHVAVTETVYGVRAFLEAKVLTPGRSLVDASRSRRQAALDDMGERPRFDISPDQITPANYMRLAGRFRASNVEPPPPPISRLTRVYKTDSASATGGTDSFNGGKIADVLVPFYGQYQRFAITDNVELPEGYGVLDVDVAVSHGANGVSMPAHLPLTLPGTAMYAATSFMPFTMGILGIAFLPAWIWSVAYAASPLLHYNTDSSNVTVTIGTQGKDSAYYFFEPDDLLDIIMDLFQAISAASPGLLDGLSTAANQRLAEMRQAAEKIPGEIATQVGTAVEGALTRVKKILEKIAGGDLAGAAEDVVKVDQLALSLTLTEELNAVFAPVTSFMNDLTGLLESEIGDAIQVAMAEVLSRMDNNQRLEFTASRGMEGTLPIAVNALALNAGVTVTVSACLMRTGEGLARWQLRTFESFYQSYLQQLPLGKARSTLMRPKGSAGPRFHATR